MNEITQLGISALKSGNRDVARHLLTAAIKQDPNDAVAWLWLTGTLEKDEERIVCLRQVLKIDPGNQAAARGLAKIMERRPAQQGQPLSSAGPVTASGLLETGPALPIAPGEPLSSASAALAMESTPAGGATSTGTAAPGLAKKDELSPAAVESSQAAQPAASRRARRAAETSVRPIFRTRPSLVPALSCFWLFLFGAIAVSVLLKNAADVGLLFAAGLGLILEIVVLYAIIRIMAERYELTSQQLTLRFRGKRATIPVKDIVHAEMTQSFLQRLIGIGNIEIDASVGGELAHLRMRNIPQCRKRAEQMQSIVREYAST